MFWAIVEILLFLSWSFIVALQKLEARQASNVDRAQLRLHAVKVEALPKVASEMPPIESQFFYDLGDHVDCNNRGQIATTPNLPPAISPSISFSPTKFFIG